MKPIATDKSDFEELRKAGQIYVDKTAYFHRLITDPCRSFFFCARPRRFGKSLGVTTMKSIFLGHREFFADLAIAKTDYDFEPHTVIHFNWGGVKAISPIGMLYQTGYLTIKDYSPYKHSYVLAVPDEEVRQDLSALLAAACANRDMAWAQELGLKLLDADWEPFFEGLKALYMAMAYGPTEGRKHETSYARCLAFLLAVQGFRFRMEDVQADGRADIIAEHPCGICIFEIKVDEPASVALDQVKAKGYDAPYRAKGLPISAVGLSFDSKTRHLADAAAQGL